MSIYLILILLFLGLLTGFYSGLLGTGGNVIIIPAMDLIFLYFNVNPDDSVRLIIAHSLFVTMFLGFSVSLKQYKIGNFFPKDILYMGIPGMVTAFVITEFIKTGTWYSKTYFDIVFLLLMIGLAARMLFFKAKVNEDENAKNKYGILMLGGVIAGSVTSLSGLGGGVILIPFLTDIAKKPIIKASSISIGVITLMAISVSSNYFLVDTVKSIPHVLPYQTKFVSIPLILPIIIGVFLSSAWGVKVAQKSKPQNLRIIFGFIILLVAAKMVHSLITNNFL